MRRNGVVVFSVVCSLMLSATSFVAQRTAEARKPTCEDKDERIDKLETDLRLRTGELAVARSQLHAVEKKLAKCSAAE